MEECTISPSERGKLLPSALIHFFKVDKYIHQQTENQHCVVKLHCNNYRIGKRMKMKRKRRAAQ